MLHTQNKRLDPEELLRASGVTPTLGQTLGGKYKSFEQFLENLPFASSVRTAQDKATTQFNSAIYNRSLSKLDQKLPENLTGFEAFDYTNKTISDSYDKVLEKVKFSLDIKTMANINQVVKKTALTPDQETKVNQSVNTIIYKYFPIIRTHTHAQNKNFKYTTRAHKFSKIAIIFYFRV
jgi:hypothetical protein